MTDALEESVKSFERMIGLLQTTVDTLKHDSEDNTHLTETLLMSRRVFELVPEYDVQRAKLSLIEEVDPIVKTLEDKLQKSTGKLQRELDTIQQTCELNKLRLNNNHRTNLTTGTSNEMDAGNLSTDVVVMGSSTNEELDTLRALKNRKQELEERLAQLQS
ncbi:Spc19p NDAI_0C04740 [Naumovozyma dairenensis CBS 421]|uniref:DASH complex subunit SPC19 n=1 Tax=Naumovozyma dairenensis (strain ATCC 10597 / BCRC 20456 / CBS 421 / NBRC 0211 / NRRL Y-12639) TaxID=1071378 RepID=G0W8M2_NAUDC|nr:hypothetical protein NDAI_0C04740 [Naumovozyma dairenensis CBS 421]CCD24133.1 hypothetical protein NDAI_0C04740 [Naumovozyma dairenensis CBS 421]